MRFMHSSSSNYNNNIMSVSCSHGDLGAKAAAAGRFFSTAPGRLAADHDDHVRISETSIQEGSSGLATQWSEFSNLSNETQRALSNVFKYKTMTPVQENVLRQEASGHGNDLLVRARTGTGKTLAFLVAGLEYVKSAKKRSEGTSHVQWSNWSKNDAFSVLVLSPTRELATQISVEAVKLSSSHRIDVVNIVGGESKFRQLRGIERARPDSIMVATPGRLIDLLQTEAMVKEKLSGVQVLIYDEADQLLDMGFRQDMSIISSFLPAEKRTFMFSATLSSDIQTVAKSLLRKNQITKIDTVPANEEPTHTRISQTVITAPYSQHLPTLVNVIQNHTRTTAKPKIIVFLNTTAGVGLVAQTLKSIPRHYIGDLQVLNISAKLDMRARVKVSDQFRNLDCSILVTSDVSARGVDYPNVTLVVQLGVASSTDQYVHRIGRTGRAGKQGEGLLILAPYEKRFLDALRNVTPIQNDTRFDPAFATENAELTEEIKHVLGNDHEGRKSAYHGFYGFYLGQISKLGISKDTLVTAAEEYATGFLCMRQPPQLSSSMISKLGLNRVSALRPKSPIFGGSRSGFDGISSLSSSRFGDFNSDSRGNESYAERTIRLSRNSYEDRRTPSRPFQAYQPRSWTNSRQEETFSGSPRRPYSFQKH